MRNGEGLTIPPEHKVMYGCYPKKLATTLGYPESKGQELHDDFWKFNKPIELLLRDLESSYKHNGGFIRGLDGRPLFIREKRKLLNSLLQNAAAMVFKRWMVMVDEYTECLKPEVLNQIIAYHDELQMEYHGSVEGASTHADVICQLALDAGQYYGVCVPTPAEAKIGKNWKETH